MKYRKKSKAKTSGAANTPKSKSYAQKILNLRTATDPLADAFFRERAEEI